MNDSIKNPQNHRREGKGQSSSAGQHRVSREVKIYREGRVWRGLVASVQLPATGSATTGLLTGSGAGLLMWGTSSSEGKKLSKEILVKSNKLAHWRGYGFFRSIWHWEYTKGVHESYLCSTCKSWRIPNLISLNCPYILSSAWNVIYNSVMF